MELKLSNGNTVRYDDADHELVSRFHWYALRDGNMTYAYSNVWRTEDGQMHPRKPPVPAKQTTVKMHRLITGATPGVLVDHRDLDGLNNHRSNLRDATIRENQLNTGKRRHVNGVPTSSTYKGVYLHKPTGRWLAQIRFAGEKNKTHIGYYDTQEEAAVAYDLTAQQRREPHERLNFTWKVCTDPRCAAQGEPQPAELNFSARSNRPGAYQSRCRTCAARNIKERRANTPGRRGDLLVTDVPCPSCGKFICNLCALNGGCQECHADLAPEVVAAAVAYLEKHA